MSKLVTATLVLAALLTAGCGTSGETTTTALPTRCTADAVLRLNPLYAGCAQSIHNDIADRLAATAKR